MKLLLVVAFCALAAAADPESVAINNVEPLADNDAVSRNIVNQIVANLVENARKMLLNGVPSLGVPPLDPLTIRHYDIHVPSGIVNINLGLKHAFCAGLAGFVVNDQSFNMLTWKFTLDATFPLIDVFAEEYDLTGDLFRTVPLYGKGKAAFKVVDFRFKATFTVALNGLSGIRIRTIDDLSFEIPSFNSDLEGVIGGGNIDGIVNDVIDEVIVGYIMRFHDVTAKVAMEVINLVLSQINLVIPL